MVANPSITDTGRLIVDDIVVVLEGITVLVAPAESAVVGTAALSIVSVCIFLCT